MTCLKCGTVCLGIICADCNGEPGRQKAVGDPICRVCGTGCYGGICKRCNGENPKIANTLFGTIALFRERHMHLEEPDVIASLNEEMPNWDEVISNKFIIFCMEKEVITPDIDGTFNLVKQPSGHHVVRIRTTYIDWASKRHSPSKPWPAIWEDDMG